jgi:hypothetical protein
MTAIQLIFMSGLIGLSGFLLWVVLTGPSE